MSNINTKIIQVYEIDGEVTTCPKDKLGNILEAKNGTLTLLYYSEERFKAGM